MTKKEFLKSVSNSNKDILQIFLDAIDECHADYCLIGGLAVNAYVEPVVSLDLDIVVAANKIDSICKALEHCFLIEYFEHGINLKHADSDLRIQLQTDTRYQPFIEKSVTRNVLGYAMKVACLEDVFAGKIWAYSDQARRKSKKI